MKNTTFKFLASAVLAASFLSACGGGDISSPATPAAATPTVTGTAATGAAIPAGSVSMNCVSGATGIATTGTDGSYSLSVSGVTFPCVARVTATTGEKLHSYVAAAGTANITPVTELLVANLTGGTALDAFDKFDATKAKALTAAQVTTAIAAVKAYLVTLGVSVTDFPADPIGTKLVAKAGTTAGDKADAVLDDLAAKLKTASKKLSDAVAEVNKSTSTTTTTTTAGGVGCTGNVLAFFTKNKGSYPVVADLYTPGPLGAAATVAGLKDKAATTMVVSENCTVTIASTVLAYKDGSYSSYPDGQVNIEITAAGFEGSSFEAFGNGGRLASIADAKTKAYGNFFTK